MPAFFITSRDIDETTISVTGALLHHLRASLRVRVNETLHFTDDQGRRHHATVTEITRDRLLARIVKSTERPSRVFLRIMLGQAILKGDPMEWLIQKATELSVDSIVPLITNRSIVRPTQARVENQRGRWQRIALEAAQQSEQWQVPEVHSPCPVREFFAGSQAASRLILAERIDGPSLAAVSLPTDPTWTVALAVGPEGGWHSDEVALARQHAFVPVTLGSAILRAETAALAALAVLQSRFGRLGNC